MERKTDFITPPGDTLSELLGELKMTQTELTRLMGRPLTIVHEIIEGREAITNEIALQLEKVFGVSASFWNRRESNYHKNDNKE